MCYTTAAPATLAKNGASLFFLVEYSCSMSIYYPSQCIFLFLKNVEPRAVNVNSRYKNKYDRRKVEVNDPIDVMSELQFVDSSMIEEDVDDNDANDGDVSVEDISSDENHGDRQVIEVDYEDMEEVVEERTAAHLRKY